jgi:divalent metal cation (Fe/Co/Zn/Cd) transporter
VGGSEHHHHARGHSHTHGLVDDSIKRSRTGLRAVALALLVLALTAGVQAVVFAASGSVALLADLIHNTGDAATAIPLGIAFALRSASAERWAGLAVVAAIFVSACVAGYEAVDRLVSPRDVENLVPLAAAGALGFAGNWVAALIRTRAGRRLESAALVADGDHARADAYVSLGVVASAGVSRWASPCRSAHRTRDLWGHPANHLLPRDVRRTSRRPTRAVGRADFGVTARTARTFSP